MRNPVQVDPFNEYDSGLAGEAAFIKKAWDMGHSLEAIERALADHRVVSPFSETMQ